MDPIDQQIVEFDLSRIKDETFVREIQHIHCVDSTNNVALQRPPCGDGGTPHLILATEQTAGRGRGENQWWAGRGSLTFSLVIDPLIWGINERSWPKVALVAGVSICETLESEFDPKRVQLKWPNDVLLEQKKVSGVLVEIASPSRQLVIGIGVNVNNSLRQAPDELHMLATSMTDVAEKTFDVNQVLIRLLRRLHQNIDRLGADDQQLVRDWRKRNYLLGRTVTLQGAFETVSGTCVDVDQEGALVLDVDGAKRQLFSGVITLVK